MVDTDLPTSACWMAAADMLPVPPSTNTGVVPLTAQKDRERSSGRPSRPRPKATATCTSSLAKVVGLIVSLTPLAKRTSVTPRSATVLRSTIVPGLPNEV